jgi:hypothetical protein
MHGYAFDSTLDDALGADRWTMLMEPLFSRMAICTSSAQVQPDLLRAALSS